MVATLNQPQYQPWPTRSRWSRSTPASTATSTTSRRRRCSASRTSCARHFAHGGLGLPADQGHRRAPRRPGGEAERRDREVQEGLQRRGGDRPHLVAIAAGHPAADRVRPQHAQDHEGARARRRRPAAPCADADRGDAAVRRSHAGAHGRHGARGVVVPQPPAHAAPRGRSASASSSSAATAASPGRSTARCCVARSSSSGRSAKRGPRGRRGPSSAARARSTLRFRRYDVAAHWEGFVDKPTYHDAQAVAHRLAELYTEQEVDRVVLVYNRFVSPLVQRVTVSDLLPIPEHVLEGSDDEDETRRRRRSAATSSTSRSRRRSSSRLLPGLPRDRDLPRAARVGGVVPRRADDGDAQRVEERGRADRHATRCR